MEDATGLEGRPVRVRGGGNVTSEDCDRETGLTAGEAIAAAKKYLDQALGDNPVSLRLEYVMCELAFLRGLRDEMAR